MEPSKTEVGEATARFVEWAKKYGYKKGHSLLCRTYSRDVVTAVETSNRSKVVASERGRVVATPETIDASEKFKSLYEETTTP